MSEILVFVSWSGDVAKEVGLRIHEWLPSIVPGVEPYYSDEDIEGGEIFITNLLGSLMRAHYGIICVTQESLKSPWVNFEAGAIAAAQKRACPLLINMRRSELAGPLSFLQANEFDESGFRKLAKQIAKLADLPDERFSRNFDAVWPKIAGAPHPKATDVQDLSDPTPPRGEIAGRWVGEYSGFNAGDNYRLDMELTIAEDSHGQISGDLRFSGASDSNLIVTGGRPPGPEMFAMSTQWLPHLDAQQSTHIRGEYYVVDHHQSGGRLEQGGIYRFVHQADDTIDGLWYRARAPQPIGKFRLNRSHPPQN